ncbi:MAG: hypothetical protein WDA13_00970 [Candidatus Shapirobacteria bacterium]
MKLKKTIVKDVTTEVAGPTVLSAISIINPSVGLVATFLYGTVRTIIKWKSDRIEEINSNIGIKKIEKLINRDEKTRDILHRILEKVIDESSEEKRKIFYAYIHNLDKINDTDFDYHTKLISTVEVITFDELSFFYSFSRDFREMELLNDKKDIDSKVPNGLSVSQIMKHKHYDHASKDLIEYSLNSLANYGLIYASFGRYGGTFFGPVTYFGKKFIEYLESD